MREAPRSSVPETAPGRSTSIQRLIGSLAAGYRSVCGEGSPHRRANSGFHPRVEPLEERELLSAVPLDPPDGVTAAEVGSLNPGAPDAQAVDAVMENSLTELAWELQQQYDFSYPGSYYENEHGLREKTVRSNALNAWVGILPNGNILNMDRGRELLHAGDPAFHEDPSLLFNASADTAPLPVAKVPPPEPEVSPTLTELASGLQTQYHFRVNGRMYFNEHKRNEKEFWSDTLSDWVIILPNGDIHRPGNGYPFLVASDPAFYADPSLLFNAQESLTQKPAPDTGGEAASAAPSLQALAWELQQQYDFSYPGSYYENEHGLGEKTVRSNTLNAWVGILPNGNILNMDKGKELLHTGDPAFHEDPSLLFNAQESPAEEPAPITGGEAAPAAPSFQALAWELNERYGFTSSGDYYENEHGLGEKTIRSTVLNAWVGILPNGNILNMDKGKELLHAGDPAFYEDPSLLFNASADTAPPPVAKVPPPEPEVSPTLTELASSLQTQYRFRINGQLYYNEHKRNEKEFWSDTLNDWVIILPNGDIHRPGNGYPFLVASDPAFHEDPSLLFDAAIQEEPLPPGVAPELFSRVQAAVSTELTVQIHEEAEALMEDYEAESQTLLTSVSVTNRELARIQGVQLFERSSFYIHGNDIEPILRRVMPGIFPENLAEYITRQAELLNEEPGHIQDRILMQQSDYRRIAGGLLGFYEGTMSDLLNLTMDRIARMQAGGLSEPNLMRDLREAIGRANISRYIGEIASFGIRIPSAEELYREGQRLFTEEQVLLQHIQSEQGRLQEIDNFRASFREWQLNHGQPDLSVLAGSDRGRADNGYQGTLTAGEERRLGRAQRLADAAIGAMFDRRIQMRVVPDDVAIGQRLVYAGDGLTYLDVHPSEQETLVAGVLDAIASNVDNRGRAEVELSRGAVSSMHALLPDAGTQVLGGSALVLSESLELPAGTNELSRWWATAGEGPIDMDWKVHVEHEGTFALHMQGFEGWGVEHAILAIDGVHEMPLVRTVSGFRSGMDLSLPAGGHTFTLRGVGVPQEAGVHPGRFTLMQINGLAPIVEADMKTLLIADHEEEFLNAGKVFRVEGVPEAMDVHELINHFAPVLKFSEGEKFSVPFAVDPSSVPTTARSDVEMDLSAYAPDWRQGTFTEQNTESAVYASVIRNDEIGELAINYNFYFPRSNWSEYGGQNTHEGDWEGATVFLKMNGDMRWVPDRVAVGQHIKYGSGKTEASDGGQSRLWNSLELAGNQPKLYVGLGGHALYFESGVTNWLTPDTDIVKAEQHTGDGVEFNSAGNSVYLPRVESAVRNDAISWLLYAGYWGNDNLRSWELGDTAPKGPIFVSSGFPEGMRWLNPWEWSEHFNY